MTVTNMVGVRLKRRVRVGVHVRVSNLDAIYAIADEHGVMRCQGQDTIMVSVRRQTPAYRLS